MSKTLSRILIVILSFFILLSISTKVYGAGIEVVWGGEETPRKVLDNLYCAEKGKPTKVQLLFNGDVISEKEYSTTYELDWENRYVLEPSVGYALWAGMPTNSMSLQDVTWRSKIFTGDSNVLAPDSNWWNSNFGSDYENLEQRSIQYAKVYYGVYERAIQNNQLFSSTTKQEDLKVMVDQIGKTYTVGPYNLKIGFDTPDEYKQLLYNELLGKNEYQTDENTFAKYEISGIPGTNIKYIDKEGKEIDFPDFINGSDFYIKFTPNNDGDITYTGNPTFNVGFLNGFSANVKRYKAQTLDFDVDGNIKLTNKDMVSGSEKVDNSKNEKSTKSDGTEYVSKQHGTATFKGKFTLMVKGGASANYEITVTDVPIERTISQYGTVGKWNITGGSYELDPDAGNYEVTGSHTVSKGGHWKFDVTEGSKDISYAQQVTNVYERPGSETKEWIPEKKEVKDYNYVPGYKSQIENNGESKVESTFQPGDDVSSDDGKWDTFSIKLPGKEIDEKLGGNVWIDVPMDKLMDYNGKKDTNESPYAGMEVRLMEINGENGDLRDTRVTDSNGHYQFEHLNPLKKYYVEFRYNGLLYQATYYKNKLTGGYSNAKENDREEFNTIFEKIDSTGNNYNLSNSWHEVFSYGSDNEEGTKLKQGNGEFISYNQRALEYKDAVNQFENFAIEKGSYESAFSSLETWLAGLGVGTSERANIIQFMKDSMIMSSTHQDDPLLDGNDKIVYPIYDRFVLENETNPPTNLKTEQLGLTYYYLYTKVSDQSRYVDFGIYRRTSSQLKILKELYKAKVVENGKIHEYKYNKKSNDIDDEGKWNITVRASDSLYNGEYKYTREVRSSEYIYNGSEIYNDSNSNSKNLQMYVTYLLVVRNTGNVNNTVNEIVDYYDADQYTFDGVISGNTYNPEVYNSYDQNGNIVGSYIQSYQGTRDGNNILNDSTQTNIVISDNSTLGNGISKTSLTGGNYNYKPLYISGIKGKDVNGKEVLGPSEMLYLYVTFKVKNDKILDEDLTTREQKIGKRNIAEINGYSSYNSENIKIPDYLGNNDELNEIDVSYKPAGLVDSTSRPGSVRDTDLNKDTGDIRTSTDSTQNRLEPDTDKAPNLAVQIDEDNVREINGFTFEDARSIKSGNAFIGNGIYNPKDKDAKDDGKTDQILNGITLELVELVQDVDEHGISKNTYNSEKVWSSMKYDTTTGKLISSDDSQYYSGQGKSRVILSGPEGTILYVAPRDTGTNGNYAFTSLPTGEFFIRFIYGDTTRNVLLNDGNNEVNKLINNSGMNNVSINGQDYKSTTYQTGISQIGTHNGINAYLDSANQNSALADVMSIYPNKSLLYYYNIDESEKVKNVSDAKDVYDYRQRTINYSNTEMKNNKAEILDSFERLATYKSNGINSADLQNKMIATLMNNTFMIAESGVIDTEFEKDSTQTYNQSSNNKIEYKINDLDFGVQERPEAGLKLNKQVANLEIDLQNGHKLFDASQSVSNLIFSKHNGHNTGYNNLYRMINPSVDMNNTAEKPELILAYIDDELITNSTIKVTYRLQIQNVGEVDYTDRLFYYTGKTSDGIISTTNGNQVIDYVSNLINYQPSNQENGTNWQLKSLEDLINNPNKDLDSTDLSLFENDYVNRQYINTIANKKGNDYKLSYNTILSTDKLGGDLLPVCVSSDKSSKETSLYLTSVLSTATNYDYLIYNNLSEIISTTNTMGRRMQYSIVGNQVMANQSLGNDTKKAGDGVFTQQDLVTPSEIDADSAQKINLLPPTGDDKNIIYIIITLLISTMIISGTIIVIKKKII